MSNPTLPLYEPYDPVPTQDNTPFLPLAPLNPNVRIRVRTNDHLVGWQNYDIPRDKLTIEFLQRTCPPYNEEFPDATHAHFSVHRGPRSPSTFLTLRHALAATDAQLQRAVDVLPGEGEIIWIFPSRINNWYVAFGIFIGVLAIAFAILLLVGSVSSHDRIAALLAATAVFLASTPLVYGCCLCCRKDCRVAEERYEEEWAEMKENVITV